MKTILLKLSGQIFTKDNGSINQETALHLIDQIKQLRQQQYKFGIVIGGGNFFRGASEGKQLQMQRAAADNVGMLATVMNGLILHDLFTQAKVPAKILSAVAISGVVEIINQEALNKSSQQNDCIIFTGGTGCPYFSTDTNAIIRALQINAHEVWKATNVDGVYSDDPAINKTAQPLQRITFQEALNKNLRIMDMTAFSLAQDHKLTIRVFNVWKKNSLLNAAQDATFGSTITL